MILLVVIGAMLGLLGSRGPVSKAFAGDRDAALRVEYERFGRYHAPTQLRIHVGPGIARNGTVRIWLDSGYIQALDIEEIVPEPDQVEVESNRLTFVFQVSNPSEPVTIVFHVRHEGFGRQKGQTGIENGEAVRLTQFIYP